MSQIAKFRDINHTIIPYDILANCHINDIVFKVNSITIQLGSAINGVIKKIELLYNAKPAKQKRIGYKYAIDTDYKRLMGIVTRLNDNIKVSGGIQLKDDRQTYCCGRAVNYICSIQKLSTTSIRITFITIYSTVVAEYSNRSDCAVDYMMLKRILEER